MFGLSSGTLETLVASLDRFDFAVLVVDRADTTVSRGKDKNVPRDNVVFELGLFMGGLGREQTFMVFNQTQPLDLPSDLAGVTAGTYQPQSSGNLNAALGAVSTKIKQQIQRLGLREARRSKDMATAAESVRMTIAQLERLIKLLAESRKVELSIIASRFSSMIDGPQLMDLQDNLDDLTSEGTIRAIAWLAGVPGQVAFAAAGPLALPPRR